MALPGSRQFDPYFDAERRPSGVALAKAARQHKLRPCDGLRPRIDDELVGSCTPAEYHEQPWKRIA